MGELKSSLGIDWGPLARHLQMLDSKAFNSTSEMERRISLAQAKIRAAQQQANALDAALARSAGKYAKSLGKAAAVQLAGALGSEIGIPEAARPLVNIASAAFTGAQFAGAPGAAIGAGAAGIMEAFKAIGFLTDRTERYLTHLINFQAQQETINIELRLEAKELRRQFDERLKEVTQEVDLDFYKGLQDTYRAIAQDAD